MNKKDHTRKQATKRMTKSIRLTHEEAEELVYLVKGTPYLKAALMCRWMLDGMQQFRVRKAIRAYQEGQVDLRSEAERAKLPMAMLLEEIAALKVVILEAHDAFHPGLDALR